MRICIDSSAFIPGIRRQDASAHYLLTLIGPQLPLFIPRLIAQEVTRNLATTEQVRRFYHIFHLVDFASIIDDPVPSALFQKYIGLGLPEKADAYIGAFAEWMQIDYLISKNRHFLRELETDQFKVLTPTEFLADLGEDFDT